MTAVKRAAGVDLEVMLVTPAGLREQLIYLRVGTSTRNQQKLILNEGGETHELFKA